MSSLARGFVVFSFCLAGSAAVADEPLYQYEGNVFPYDEAAGWIVFDPCDSPCSESLQPGHFVLEWPFASNQTNYHRWIAQPPQEPPASLWVEWRFRSNHPIGPNFFTCDAHFTVHFREIFDLVFMYGDAAVSFSGGGAVTGLAIGEFHTYRFESFDGVNFSFAVDGLVFSSGSDAEGNDVHYLQFGGAGGCNSDQIPDMINEWDMVRYGTISYGEQVVTTDPPSGFLDAKQHPALDRIAVTFDSPNYAYIDEISLEVSSGGTPVVTQTWRRQDDGPETLEIVLDRPIATNGHTRIIIDDGVAINIVDYSYILGDADGDGDLDLNDFNKLQECVANNGPGNEMGAACRFADMDSDTDVDFHDFAFFQRAFAGSR